MADSSRSPDNKEEDNFWRMVSYNHAVRPWMYSQEWKDRYLKEDKESDYKLRSTELRKVFNE